MPTDTNQRISSDSPQLNNVYKSKRVPDGGWGWAVVAASFVAYLIADGCAFSFGIMYAELLDYFDESKSTTAWVNSLYVSFPLLAGPLAGIVTNRYGCRIATIIGGLLSGLGFVLSFFATNIWILYGTLGVMAGIGTAFIYVPCIVVIAYYFEKRLSTATGIAVAGTGIGTFAFAPLIEYLNSVYTWRGTMLILGGLLFNVMVCGLIYVPQDTDTVSSCSDVVISTSEQEENASLPITTNLTKDAMFSQSVVVLPTYIKNPIVLTQNGDSKDVSDAARVLSTSVDKINNVQSSMSKPHLVVGHFNGSQHVVNSRQVLLAIRYHADVSSSLHRRQSISCPNVAVYDVSSDDSKENDSSARNVLIRIRKMCVEMFDPRLIRNIVFGYFVLSSLFLYIAYDVPYVYVPDLMQSIIGQRESSSHVIAISGITNTVGQMAIGYLGDKPCLSSLYLYSILTALAGVVTFFVPLMHSYWLMCIYGALYGLFISGAYALTTIVLVDMFGVDRLTSAFGMVLLGQGIAGLIGPPIAGAISDYTGSYDEVFFLSGIIMGLSGIMLFAMPCVRRLQHG